MIKIDNVTYNVPVTRMTRNADFLYKYAERTMDGTLHSEMIGVYFNYKLEFGKAASVTDYVNLWAKLTEATEFHTVAIPDEDGTHTFSAYFSNVGDEFSRIQGSNRFMKSLTVNMIAREPAVS